MTSGWKEMGVSVEEYNNVTSLENFPYFRDKILTAIILVNYFNYILTSDLCSGSNPVVFVGDRGFVFSNSKMCV